eukprot:TRINITY_DN793_c0_g4_i1.p1 TRINITY_DN793_c0_g4~~TRINITY_DN793_c0_g4_i1.p1  ORF type:complete len:295 (+),score=76.67 TRINITY_DN793_c0_g4_i1:62-886(+)
MAALLVSAGALPDGELAPSGAKGGGSLPLFARIGDRTVPLELPSDATVADLRAALRSDGVGDDAALSFGGEPLSDPRAMIADTGLSAQAVIDVSIRGVVRWTGQKGEGVQVSEDGHSVWGNGTVCGTASSSIRVRFGKASRKSWSVGFVDARELDCGSAWAHRGAMGTVGVAAWFVYNDGVAGARTTDGASAVLCPEEAYSRAEPPFLKFAAGQTVNVWCDPQARVFHVAVDEQEVAAVREHFKQHPIPDASFEHLLPFISVDSVSAGCCLTAL